MGKYSLEFIATIEPALKGMQALTNAASNISNEIKKTNDATKEAFSKIGNSTKEATQFIKSLVSEANNITTSFTNVRNNTAINNIAVSSAESEAKVIELKQSLVGIAQEMDNIANADSITTELESLDEIILQADKALKILNNDLNISENDAKELFDSLNKLSSIKQPSQISINNTSSVQPSIDNDSLLNTQKTLQELFNEVTKLDGAFENIDLNDATNQLNIFEGIIKETELQVSKLEKEFGLLDKNVLLGKNYISQLKNELQGIKTTKLFPDNEAQKVVSLRTQVQQAKQQLDNLLESSDGKITPEIIRAAKAAGNLKDRFQDLNSFVDAFNPDAKFKALANVTQGVVGGFTAVQGALGLVGVESEDVQKALLKVNSALALSQGLNQLFEMKDSFKQLKAILIATFATQKEVTIANNAMAVSQAALTTATEATTVATEATSVSMNVFKAALIATGIGAIVVLLGTLIANWDRLKSAVDSNSEGFKKFKDILVFILPPIGLLLKGIDSIREKFGSLAAFVSGIGGAFAGAFKQLGTAIAELSQGNFSNAIDAGKSIGDAFTNGFTASVKEKNLFDAVEEKLNQLKKQNVKISLDLDLKEASGKDVFAERKKLLQDELIVLQGHYKDRQDLVNNGTDDEIKAYNDKNVELLKLQNDQNEKIKQSIEKRTAELIKQQEDYSKSILEAEAGVIELTKQLNDKLNAALLEQAPPLLKIDIDEQNALDKLDEFSKQIADKNKTAIAFGVKLDVGEDGLTDENRNDIERLQNLIQEQANEKRIKIKVEQEIVKINATVTDDATKELALFDLQQKEKLKILTDAGVSQNDAVESILRERNSIVLKYELESINNAEQHEQSILEVSQNAGETDIEFQQRIVSEKLQIQLKYAQQRLSILESLGQSESQEANNLRDTIAKINSDIGKNNEKAKEEGAQIASQQINKYASIAQAAVNASRQITDALNAQLEAEQQANDERKKIIDEQLNDKQNELDAELEIAKAGFASNVSLKKKELDALNAEKKKAIEKDKKIAEEKKKVAKIEAAANLVAAGANVAVGVAKVIGSAKDPVTAVIAVIEAIAMVAAFVAQLQNIKSQTGLRDGGLIKGKAHNANGLGGEQVGNTGIWVEGGEYVVNKKTTNKYFHLIDEINKNKITHKGMSDLKEILNSNNIVFNDGEKKDFQTRVDKKEQYFKMQFDYSYQKKTNEMLEKIHKHEIDKTQIIPVGNGKVIERSGNKTVIKEI